MRCWPENESEKVERFDYPALAEVPEVSWEAFGIPAPGDSDGPFEDQGTAEADPAKSNEAQADEVRRSFASGRERGFEEGRAAEREACTAQMKARELRQAGEAAQLVEGFDAQRTHYFETVEREVVKLSLAIAARILRREAEVDLMLLSGAVRAALGQLSTSTQASLRVPPSALELWKETIARLPNLRVKPRVVAGDEMGLTECILQTDFGSVDLGVSAQLAEIERGFFHRTRQDREKFEPIEIAEDMSE